ncbi:MAG: hypothetical protein WCB68_07935, partial [Pyrinomonadaceae bacterium]
FSVSTTDHWQLTTDSFSFIISRARLRLRASLRYNLSFAGSGQPRAISIELLPADSNLALSRLSNFYF